MNAQTSGPIAPKHRGPFRDTWLETREDRTRLPFFQTVAQVWDKNGTPEHVTAANARLLAASFNAFDKAGRELGIDAATLAEGLDLAAFIRAAREAEQAMGKMRQGAFRFACARLNAALVNVESGTVASQ